MLTKFEVKNFKNFENIELNLSDVKNYEFNNICVRNDNIKTGLIYGVNGVGKTNLGYAILDILFTLTDTPKSSRTYDNYLNANCDEKYAEFVYHFKFGKSDVVYRYKKIDHVSTIEESLTINDEKVLDYNKQNSDKFFCSISGTDSLNKDLSITSIAALKYVFNNSRSTKNLDSSIVSQLFDFVNGMVLYRVSDENKMNWLGNNVRSKSLTSSIVEEGLLEKFESFLCDGGINCKLDSVEEDGEQKIVFVNKKRNISFIKNASMGTLALTALFYWLNRMEHITFLYIDEFDAYYHHSLAEATIEQLKKSEVQCIMTTHNTGNMNNDSLRPDCIFELMENQIKPVFRMTRKELRKAHNLEKIYKAGGFNYAE